MSEYLKDFRQEHLSQNWRCETLTLKSAVTCPNRAEVSLVKMHCALSHRTWFKPTVSAGDSLVTFFLLVSLSSGQNFGNAVLFYPLLLVTHFSTPGKWTGLFLKVNCGC